MCLPIVLTLRPPRVGDGGTELLMRKAGEGERGGAGGGNSDTVVCDDPYDTTGTGSSNGSGGKGGDELDEGD